MVTYMDEGIWYHELDDTDEERNEIVTWLEENITEEGYNDTMTKWFISPRTKGPVEFEIKISDYLTPKEYLLCNFDQVVKIPVDPNKAIYLAKLYDSSKVTIFEYSTKDKELRKIKSKF